MDIIDDESMNEIDDVPLDIHDKWAVRHRRKKDMR